MRVLRHRHLLGCFAILVLAMQGLMAFAHTHTHSPKAHTGLGQLAARAITYGMCRPGQTKPCTPTAPHKDHGDCAVCWSMAMAGAGMVPEPLAVLPNHSAAVVVSPVRITGLSDGKPHGHFQARAPPLA